ncbi:MAG TPA: universal stress protein [Phototrophicaceae bacterium]|nr:universal stress protein [Phototrophicaceae bacterium]
MLSHILVAIDTVKNADYLFARVDSLARAFRARITLVYLLASDQNRLQGVDALDWHLHKKEVRANLDLFAQRLRKAEVLVETALLEYAEAGIVIDFAQTHQVDLIVLTKQTEGMNDFVHILTKVATMPILILQPRGYLLSDTQVESCFRKIMIPLDGSQRAECALPFAVSLARSCQAQLLVAHIVQRPQMFKRHLPPSPEEADLAETIVTNHRNAAGKYLAQLATHLMDDVQVRLLVNDNVATALHQLARDEWVDLIVLSAHGHSGEPQRPYGSIAGSLITYNTKPVFLVQDLPLDRKELLGEPVTVRGAR